MRARHIATLIVSVLIIYCSLLAESLSICTTNIVGEEFVGPFANWSNVKTVYGAVGNGTTDDTTAIQNCLNALGSTAQTCWFPAGTYKITAGLTLNLQTGVNVIGADPATTTIKWAGSAGGTMLKEAGTSGVSFIRIERLTFDGSSSAAIAIDQSSTAGGDCCNEYADLILKNTTTAGFVCGQSGFQCSEISMLRDTFQSATNGISLGNGNALDVWCWYCQFINNSSGMTNNVSGMTAGNGSVYNSIFQNSSVSDIDFGNTAISTFLGNYSTGSARFLNFGGGGNPNLITAQGNTVAATGTTAVNAADWGPIIVIDNIFKSPASSVPVVSASASGNGNLFSMGNTYTVGTVGTCGSAVQADGHCHSITGSGGDQVVSAGSLTLTPPTLPGTPPNNNRTIFEVSSVGQLATAITNACGSIAVPILNRNVVHIQAGSYNITSTIVVPASDCQIIGDSDNTSTLTWGGASNGTLLQLSGASKVVLREIKLDGGSGTSTCLDIQKADQAGASVFGQGVVLDGGNIANLYSDSLDNTTVEMRDFQSTANSGAVPTGVLVKGGASAAAGTWLGGSTNIFNGAGFGNANFFSENNNGHLLARQFFIDGGSPASNTTAALSGTGGVLTLANIPGYTNTASKHGVQLTNFTGTSAVVDLATFESSGLGDEVISGTGSGANNLNLGLVAISATFSDTTSPADTNGFLNGMTFPAGQVAESGISSNPFLTTALSQLRSVQPINPTGTFAGVTDVRLYRVKTQFCIYGIHIEH